MIQRVRHLLIVLPGYVVGITASYALARRRRARYESTYGRVLHRRWSLVQVVGIWSFVATGITLVASFPTSWWLALSILVLSAWALWTVVLLRVRRAFTADRSPTPSGFFQAGARGGRRGG